MTHRPWLGHAAAEAHDVLRHTDRHPRLRRGRGQAPFKLAAASAGPGGRNVTDHRRQRPTQFDGIVVLSNLILGVCAGPLLSAPRRAFKPP